MLTKSDNVVRVLRGGNISDDALIFKPDDVMIAKHYVKGKADLDKNSIITPAVSSLENIGKAARIETNYKNVVVGGFVLVLTPHLNDETLSRFLFYTFVSPFNRDNCRSITHKSGQAFYNLSREKLMNLRIPLPPLLEQKRIIEVIDSIQPLVDEYKVFERKLAATDECLPVMLKKSILQHAIQGKLVPQDPNDEPARVLLERIAKERAKMGKKAAKSMSRIERRDRGTYEIFPDGSEVDISKEIPFDIPDSWGWCRLDMLGDYKKGPFGSSLTKSCFVPKASNSVKVYEQKNAIQKNHILGSYYISSEYFEKAMRSFEVHGGDIIVSCAGTIGETYKLPEEAKSGIINQALMRVRLTPLLCDSFFLMYFDYIVKVQAKESSKGSAIKNIPPFAIFKKLLMPVPPQVEQHRIVEKLGVLMEEIGVTK